MASPRDCATIRRLLPGLTALAFGVGACSADRAPAQSVPASPSSGAESVVAPSELPTVVSSTPGAEPAPPSAESGTLSWETKDAGVVVPDEWRTCTAPEDCQVVVTTCCDQCNGGKAVSVAKSHLAEARAKFKPTSCGACTLRGCSTRPFCEAGRCVLQWQSLR